MATAQTTPAATRDTDIEFRATLDRLTTLVTFCVLLLSVGVYVLSPYFAWQWVSQPFIGAFVEPTFVFNGIGPKSDPEWTLLNQEGLTFPDRLVAFNGEPFRSDDDLRRLFSNRKVGETVTLTVQDWDGSALDRGIMQGERTITVRLIPFPLSELINIFVVPYGVGLAFLLIGLWVFYLRRHEAAGRAFALFCASIAVIIGGLFDLYSTYVFSSLWAAAIPLIGAGLFTLALVFPQEVGFVSHRPYLRLITFVPAIALAIASLVAINDFENPHWYAAVWMFSEIFSALGALTFIAITVHRWRTAASPIVREQSRIIVASCLGFLPIVGWVGVSAALPEYKFSPLYFIPLITFPAGVAYAILRYRLLNTEIVLSRAIVYGVLGGLTTLGYGLLVLGISAISGATIATLVSSPQLTAILIGVTVFAIVVAFNPVRNRLQMYVDTVFFRGSQAYREQLLAFGRALTESTDLPYIAAQLRQQIETTLRPSHVHLFLRDQSRTEYNAYAGNDRPETDLRFNAEGALARVLSAENAVVYLAPDSPLPTNLLRDRARLAVLASQMFVPLNSKAGLIGWLALGHRLSGEPYSQRDIEFLESLTDQAALAIERALAFEALETRVNELNVLSQVSQAVNFSIAFDDLLELVYAQASRILDLRHFTIIMRDEARNSLKYAFFVENNERDPAREDRPWPMGQGLASEVIRNGQAILTNDYLGECSRRRVPPLSRPYLAWMGVPLNVGVGAMGAMTLGALEPGRTFTEDQLKIFAAIADQAATAIDKARLYSQTAERARQLATLNQVAQVITSTLDLDTLLERILESAVTILIGEAGSLFLIDDETGESVLRVAVGPVARDIIGIRVPPGRGIVGSAAETGQPVIVNDTANDPRWFQKPDQTTGFVSRAVMAVPLRVKDRSIGVLEVINKSNGLPFTDEDTALLTAFAGQAAVAIENARLFNLTDQALAARVEELSIMQRIDRELNSALDVKRVMAVIVHWALEATSAEAGLAGLVLAEGIHIVAHKGYGDAIRPYLDAYLPIAKGPMGRAVAGKSTSLIRDVSIQPDAIAMLPNAVAQLTIPIVREDDAIGVLVIESLQSDRFTDDHVSFLTRLADHAVTAVINANLYNEVRAANQAKTEFVSMVSHELKNPLQAIKLSSQLMMAGTAGPVTDNQQDFLTRVLTNIERMNTIVSDLTDVARIESGRLQLTLAPMQFRGVIDEVVRSLQGGFDSKQQTLMVDAPPDLPLVQGDYVRLLQIVTNLVSNAHKYSPQTAVVTLRAAVSPNHWDAEGASQVLHISVQDTGYGISPEDQAKLFTKFFRASNNLSDAPGTGLGLNIVKQMVELGGGKVWFESEVGRGSTFHFTVPLITSDSPVVA